MANSATRFFDGKDPLFRFVEDPHEYHLGDLRLWSPSSAMKQIGYVDTRPFTEAARLRGTHVHKATAIMDTGRVDSSTVSDSVLGYAMGWEKFCRDWNYRIRLREVPMYHPTLLYGVTPDSEGLTDHPLGLWKDRPTVVEMKTGDVKWWVCIQTAAQEETIKAWDVEPGVTRERLGVQVCVDGTYKKPVHFTDAHDRTVWRCLLTACQRLGEPPKQEKGEDKLSSVIEMLQQIGG